MSIALIGTALPAQAFEPGKVQICTPSADGQTFECRDKSDVSTPVVKAKPAEPSSAAPAAAASPSRSDPAPAPEANRLPNYLMQSPSAAQPQRTDPAEPIQSAAPAETITEPSEVATQNEPATMQRAAADSSPSPSAPSSMPPASASASVQPQPQPSPAVAPTPVAEKSPVNEPRGAIAQTGETPAVMHPHVSAAAEFLNLPSSHYTIVLASVRTMRELEPVIAALDNLPGQRYLLKLGMPDGDWYSLCWSDFSDIDAARAARATLPDDAAVTSGWPRRIGLLQNELAR